MRSFARWVRQHEIWLLFVGVLVLAYRDGGWAFAWAVWSVVWGLLMAVALAWKRLRELRGWEFVPGYWLRPDGTVVARRRSGDEIHAGAGSAERAQPVAPPPAGGRD